VIKKSDNPTKGNKTKHYSGSLELKLKLLLNLMLEKYRPHYQSLRYGDHIPFLIVLGRGVKGKGVNVINNEDKLPEVSRTVTSA
jgi:hypothetical protein